MFTHRRKQTPANRINGAWIVVIWIVFNTGCYETYREDPVGTLTVPFEIAYNGTGCDAAGVVRVTAVLDNGEYQIETECARYEATFENIPEGTHSLALYGLNAAGITVVDNLANGPTTVDIVAFTETAPPSPLILSESTVLLQARWDLDWGSCSSREIAYFQAKVFDPDGTVILESLVACDTVGTGPDEFRTIPDPRRALVNPAIDHIEVQAMKNKKQSSGENFLLLFDDVTVPGPGQAISLSFKCREWGCFVSGTGCDLP